MINKFINSPKGFGNNSERNILDSLFRESIQMFGMDVYYIPKKFATKIDTFLGEDRLSTYEHAYIIEMYLENYEGPPDESEFISKFGLEIRHQYIFRVSRSRYQETIAERKISINPLRPTEGDLIYIPMFNEIVEIKYVSRLDSPNSFQLSDYYSYVLKCEQFQYSSERFSTDVEEIDSINEGSYDILEYKILMETTGNLLLENNYIIVQEHHDIEESDPYASNDIINQIANDIIDFSEKNPFGNF